MRSNVFLRQKVCCGIIYKGRFGEVLIDPHLFKPCCRKKQRQQQQQQQEEEEEEEEDDEEEEEVEVEEGQVGVQKSQMEAEVKEMQMCEGNTAPAPLSVATPPTRSEAVVKEGC